MANLEEISSKIALKIETETSLLRRLRSQADSELYCSSPLSSAIHLGVTGPLLHSHPGTLALHHVLEFTKPLPILESSYFLQGKPSTAPFLHVSVLLSL